MRSLPPHLSHKSALVLLPPATISTPIEAVRRIHDKQFLRWPPHINLIYPFLACPSDVPSPTQGETASPQRLKSAIRSRLEKTAKEFPSFNMSLATDEALTFSHSKNKTVWLAPSSKLVNQLQAALWTEFSECDYDDQPFVPHLSLGQVSTNSRETQLREDLGRHVGDHLIENQINQLSWHVDTIHVIERKGFKDRFRVVGTIKLGE